MSKAKLEKPRYEELGAVFQGEDGPYISLNGKIVDVKIVKKIWNPELKKEVETEVSLVRTGKNEKMYINIPKAQDYYEFKVEQGWMEPEKMKENLDRCEEYNILRILSAKVE